VQDGEEGGEIDRDQLGVAQGRAAEMVVGVVAKGAGLPEGHPRVHQVDDHLVAVRRRAVQLQLAVAQQVQGLGLVAVPEQDLAGIEADQPGSLGEGRQLAVGAPREDRRLPQAREQFLAVRQR